MEEHKQMDPPYPTEKNRSYPPPYTEFPDVHNGPNPGVSQVCPPYPPPPFQSGPNPGVSEVCPPYPPPPFQSVPPHLPQAYPPHPPAEVAPVTVPPAAGPVTIQIIDATVNFGSKSQYVRCPNCGTQGFSTIESKPTTTTHLIAVILCCFILWPIAWLPYVWSSCQKTVHYCSNCNQYLGERTT